MLNNQEYFRGFISSMSRKENEDIPLCELILPSDLVDYMDKDAILNIMRNVTTGGINIQVKRNASNCSSTYKINASTNSAYSNYEIYVNDNETNSEALYCYFDHGIPFKNLSYKCKYSMIKKNSNGLCIMFLFDISTKKIKNIYSITRYYNNETLKFVGDLYMKPHSLSMMDQLGFCSDSDRCENMNFSSLTEAQQYFEKISSELLQDNNTLMLDKE